MSASIHIVNNLTEEERLDQYLARQMPELSRSKWQKLISQNKVKVNNKTVKASFILQNNDEIYLEKKQEENSNLIAPPKLNIVYQDEFIAVIEKEAGLVMHPAPGHDRGGTLADGLIALFGDHLSSIGGPERPGIVHRLDKDTSGLVVIAKTDEAHKKLAADFKQQLVLREYQAIVSSKPDSNEGIIDAAIARDPSNRQKMSIQYDGKESQTYFQLLRHKDNLSHLRLRLHTGRTHQIRVHLSMINCPIINDLKYGGQKATYFDGDAILLHACKLAFRHPIEQKELSFTSDLPARFSPYIQKIYSQ